MRHGSHINETRTLFQNHPSPIYIPFSLPHLFSSSQILFLLLQPNTQHPRSPTAGESPHAPPNSSDLLLLLFSLSSPTPSPLTTPTSPSPPPTYTHTITPRFLKYGVRVYGNGQQILTKREISCGYLTMSTTNKIAHIYAYTTKRRDKSIYMKY